MENKKKSYFIVKEEVGQSGAGNFWYRYRAPGVFPRDPSMVGLYASPMMNRPDNVTDSIELARSIGRIRGDPTKTLPGSIVGSPYPGSVTIPNRPFGLGLGLGVPVMPTLGTPCGVSPCGEQRIMGVPGFAAVPIRKGDFTPGVFDIRPIFPYHTYGVTSTQQATMKFTFGDKTYTVKLPYGEINGVIKVLDEHRADSTTGAIKIEISVPAHSWFMPLWFWPSRVRSRSIETFADMFKKLLEVKDVKFQDASGKDLTSKDVIDQIVAEATKKINESATKSEEEKRKNQEAVKKLSETAKPAEAKAEEKTPQEKEIEQLKQRLAELEAAAKK